MSSPGYHAAEEGTLARSTGGAAARGAMLIALALVIGLLLVMFALDDPQTQVVAAETPSADADAEGAGDAVEGGGAEGDSGAPPAVGEPSENGETSAAATIPPVDDDTIIEDPPVQGEIFPPNEVTVLVANGTGGAGVAGAVADVLNADGYITTVSNAPATVAGVVLYQPGFAENAVAIGQALGAAPDAVLPAPADIAVDPGAIADGRVAGAQVVVIIGTEGVVPVS